MNDKQTFYRLEKRNDSIPDANYRMLLGERSNGKSYAVKERGIMNAWNSADDKFMLFRRWGIEVKASYIEQYFKDAPITAITKNECNTVNCTGGKIFLARYNPESKVKVNSVAHIGYYRDLCGEQHFVSQNFDDVSMGIFEEFISRDYYLPNEPTKLFNFVSTFARRRFVPVYMIGNTISRVCPYFRDWELTRIPRQKIGTIDKYEIHTGDYDDDGNEKIVIVSVEYCENSGKNSKMFFGKSSEMITSGTWQVKSYPHLEGKIENYRIMHKVIFIHTGFKFEMFFMLDNDNQPFWYVRPFNDDVTTDKFKTMRFVTHTYNETLKLKSLNVTIGFTPLSPDEKIAFNYLERIRFSDNLTGTDFNTCLQTINRT